jgi:deoxyribose-phosphate aldolase
MNLDTSIRIRDVEDPHARRILRAFNLDRNTVVDTREAPQDVLDLVREPGRAARDPRNAEPIVKRLAAGSLKPVAGDWDRELAARIDHTLLNPQAKPAEIEKLCEEAVLYGFRAVCVMPKYVPYAKQLLLGSQVKIACVIGFPAGTASTAVKVKEAREAVRAGATEIDVVANTGLVVEGKERPLAYAEYHDDLEKVTRAARLPVKVIIQTGLLRKAAEAAGPEGAQAEGDRLVQAASVLSATALVHAGCKNGFVKTCDGVYAGVATVEDVTIMATAVRDFAGVKASAGVRTPEDAAKLVASGADVFGTSSGPKLVKREAANGY